MLDVQVEKIGFEGPRIRGYEGQGPGFMGSLSLEIVLILILMFFL